ncbi:MAG: hypothetical protein CMA12_07780 [Euryarchaeota archaeon]|nr:hypothetical protein [Euryarchaeota archaeon]
MSINFTKTRLFTPRTIRRMLNDSIQYSEISHASLSSSFEKTLDPNETSNSAFRSTRDIDVDFSKFENHTFFNSAESNVNVAFDLIINKFPFDGNKKEHVDFFENLTGWENYLFSIFPKHKGFLWFNNNLSSSISVADSAGHLFPSLSRRNDGFSVIDFKRKSFSVEFHLHPDSEYTYDQIIAQKLSVDKTQGFSIFLTQNESDSTKSDLCFVVSSGSETYISASAPINKSNWNHVTCVFDRENDLNKAKIILSGTTQYTSERAFDFGNMNIQTQPLSIGSGSNHNFGNDSSNYNFINTLSGAMDEFRVWHNALDEKMITKFMNNNVYSSDDLKLYFKFNEMTGSYTGNSTVLDHSGNSLHTRVSNFNSYLRQRAEVEVPLQFERMHDNPVLFPDDTGLKELNSRLLKEAIIYDFNNPSLIINMIPKHYLVDSKFIEGKSDEFGGVGDDYGFDEDFPGGGAMTSPQIIASLLYTWAKMFDEVKLYIDQFSKLIHVDYGTGNIPPKFLAKFSRMFGIELPNLFANASNEQFHDGKNITTSGQLNGRSLKKIQYEIWKRLLVNLPFLMRSKGTIESIKGLLRATGINPDRNFRFKEFGGSKHVRLTDTRKAMSKVSKLLDYSGSFSGHGPIVTSPFLSASRTEPGAPFTSSTGHDVLLTSGSFTYEGTYRFNPKNSHPLTQSLARFYVTGTNATTAASTGIPQGGLIFHLMAFANTNFSTGSIKLFARPSEDPSIKAIQLDCPAGEIFDGSPFYVSFGRKRNDFIQSQISSSYFLRYGKQNNGEIKNYNSNERLYYDGGSDSVLQKSSTTFNSSGSYFEIGNTTITRFSDDKFLNCHPSSFLAPPLTATTGSFTGQVKEVRFWTLPLSSSDSREHVLNYESIGVTNPKINFNFVTNLTGSYEKLRVHYPMNQTEMTASTSGRLQVFDQSQNLFHGSGVGFVPSSLAFSPFNVKYTILDPKFEESSVSNNVRIRGMNTPENIENYESLVAPQYHVPYDDHPVDDNRLSMEISLTQALDEDIMNILGTLDMLNNSLGDPALMFSSNYPDFEILRDIYFNRLTDKINFKSFFEFFKWFDVNIGDIVDQMIPSNTDFLGANFVIESHVLERHKTKYLQGEIYVRESDRRQDKGFLMIGTQEGQITRKF